MPFVSVFAFPVFPTSYLRTCHIHAQKTTAVCLAPTNPWCHCKLRFDERLCHYDIWIIVLLDIDIGIEFDTDIDIQKKTTR